MRRSEGENEKACCHKDWDTAGSKFDDIYKL
jgi:hypothetical protein